MELSSNIKRLRTEKNLTQEQLANAVGVTRATVTQWETGWSQPRMGAVEKLAAFFGVSISDIVDGPKGNALPPNSRPATGMAMGLAPRLGRVHAGVLAEPDVFDDAAMVRVPQFLLDADPDSFVVSSEGDCMDRVFSEGSDLVVSKRKEPQDKSIVLASIDGYDYIVRRLRLTANTLILSPESHNPAYEDIIISRDSEHTVEIPGVVTWYQAPKEME